MYVSSFIGLIMVKKSSWYIVGFIVGMFKTSACCTCAYEFRSQMNPIPYAHTFMHVHLCHVHVYLCPWSPCPSWHVTMSPWSTSTSRIFLFYFYIYIYSYKSSYFVLLPMSYHHLISSMPTISSHFPPIVPTFGACRSSPFYICFFFLLSHVGLGG